VNGVQMNESVKQKLIGVLTLDDVLDLLCSEFEDIGKLIRRESPASFGKL